MQTHVIKSFRSIHLSFIGQHTTITTTVARNSYHGKYEFATVLPGLLACYLTNCKSSHSATKYCTTCASSVRSSILSYVLTLILFDAQLWQAPPAASKKRKKSSAAAGRTSKGSSSSKRSSKKKKAATVVQWGDVPLDVQQKIQAVIANQLSLLQSTKSDDNSEPASPDLGNNNISAIAVCDALENELNLSHLSVDEIAQALSQNGGDGGEIALQQVAADAHRQSQKVRAVFRLLDPAGKGCVVIEDLQRAVHELELPNGAGSGADGEEWNVEQLEEMVNLFDSSGGAGILSLNDLARIAREVNL